MKLLLTPRSISPKSSAHCLVNRAGFDFRPFSTLPRFQFHPFTKNPSNVRRSISNNGPKPIQDGKMATSRFGHLIPSAIASSSSPDIPLPSQQIADKRAAVIIWSAITLSLAVANRVLQKLALVPMKGHPLFLAQLNSFALISVYFSILNVRHRVGITTDEMLAIPKLPFMIIGLLEAVAVVSGMYAGAMLPGPAIPLLNQTFLVWQLLISSLLLGRKYSLNQILGCLLVGAGVVVAVTSGSGNARMLSGIGLLWPALMIGSSAFQAAASIVKESVFVNAAKNMKGKSLDVFVVNAFGSGFQALFILMFLPLLTNLQGIPFSQILSYFKSGAGCFLNVGTSSIGCNGAPLLPFLYILSNLFFNVSILNLLKVSDAIIASLAVRASVPIAIYVLSMPLPYLPHGVSLSPFFHMGSLILVLGLVLYNVAWPWKNKKSQ